MSQVIYYHGTKVDNYVQIIQEGFRPGTFFARHLEDALEFGGSVVFRVVFSKEEVANQDWQFLTWKTVKPDRIVSVTNYRPQKWYDAPRLQEQVFRSNTA